MWFSRKQAVKVLPKGAADGVAASPKQVTTKSLGDAAESAALAYLAGAGLRLIESNYRTPGRGGGEVDLIMRAPDGTLVFVEVRQRSNASHGGAGASISAVKQRRIIFAARYYLMRFASPPPCRFDVVLVNGALSGGEKRAAIIEWLPAAFDVS
jgi:putative endonuclease